ncbi:nitroreductase family protein [uncultured Campylobacter sp.]|uniref:nitroreductase family protein n=1 Tax=uncultured Campylobacter sp. TaxID=218934 RepID=UPI00345BA949
MQLLEAMKKRRSVREFNAEVPSKEEIQAILEAAYLAPALLPRRTLTSALSRTNIFCASLMRWPRRNSAKCLKM